MKFFRAPAAGDWLRPSVVALVAANLVPVAGVLLFGWKIFPLIFLYWSENVVIGVFNVLKMIFCAGAKNPAAKLFIIPFFCVHYGLFTFVHGIFVVKIFGESTGTGGLSSGFNLFGEALRTNHLGWAVLGIIVSRGISFITNFIGQGEFRRVTLEQLMAQPYGRIIVLHVAILGGGFLILALHSPLAGLLLFIALKIAFDLSGHLRERDAFGKNRPPETKIFASENPRNHL